MTFPVAYLWLVDGIYESDHSFFWCQVSPRSW